MRLTTPALLSIALTVAVLPGCGGSDGDEPARGAAGPQQPLQQQQPQPDPENPLALPPGVPKTGSGAAPADARRAIEQWLAGVRRADFAKAADAFAVPTKVQNGSPVIVLDSRALIRGWAASLPCGAVLTDLKAAPRGFTIASFRLTERKGGSCGSGTGGRASSAIRVAGGKITEWYRLPEAGAPPPQQEQPAEPGQLV